MVLINPLDKYECLIIFFFFLVILNACSQKSVISAFKGSQDNPPSKSAILIKITLFKYSC